MSTSQPKQEAVKPLSLIIENVSEGKKEITRIENHPRPEFKQEEKLPKSSKRFKSSINSRNTTSKKSFEVKFKDEVEEIKDNLPSDKAKKEQSLHVTPQKVNSPVHKHLKSVKEHKKTPYSKLKENDSEEEKNSKDKSKNEKHLLSAKKHMFGKSEEKENPFLTRSENKVYNLRNRERVDYAQKNKELEDLMKSKGIKDDNDSDDESVKEGASLGKASDEEEKEKEAQEEEEKSDDESYDSDELSFDEKDLQKEAKLMNKELD